MPHQTFIGIDLAWRSKQLPSAVAVLTGSSSGAELVEGPRHFYEVDELAGFALGRTDGGTLVAIDAPLIIKNLTGQRACETLVSRRYGSRDASCHTSNLGLFPNARSVQLARMLVSAGFTHATTVSNRSVSKVVAEVYPHAAIVAMFDLPKIVKYKKGTVAAKRAGLAELASLISSLSGAEPPLRQNPALDDLLSKKMDALRGQGLKLHEDALDSVICAYLAVYFARWGWDRNEAFGNETDGYIMNPKLVPGGVVPSGPSEWTS